MPLETRWVLLAYRLPREPSTPRIALWRRLRALGAVQLLDGLVALPLDSRNREQLEWLAEDVLEAGGEAAVWLADAASAAQSRAVADSMQAAVAAEYRALIAAADEAGAADPVSRARVLRRLRRELRRVRERDYFTPPERAEAEEAVAALVALAAPAQVTAGIPSEVAS